MAHVISLDIVCLQLGRLQLCPPLKLDAAGDAMAARYEHQAFHHPQYMASTSNCMLAG